MGATNNEQTFNGEGSLYLAYNEKRALLLLNNHTMQESLLCYPLSFGQYIN